MKTNNLKHLMEYAQSSQVDGYSKEFARKKLGEKARSLLEAINFQERIEDILQEFDDANLQSDITRTRIAEEIVNRLDS